MRDIIGSEITRVSPPGELPLQVAVEGRPASATIWPLLQIIPILLAVGLFVGYAPADDRGMYLAVGAFILGIVAFKTLPKLHFGGGVETRNYEIDRDEVRCLKGDFGTYVDWRAPLSEYSGVLWQHELEHRLTRNRANGRQADPVEHHAISLDHPDRDRRVPLFYERTGADLGDVLAVAGAAIRDPAPTGVNRVEAEARNNALIADIAAGNPRARWHDFARLLDMDAIDGRHAP